MKLKHQYTEYDLSVQHDCALDAAQHEANKVGG